MKIKQVAMERCKQLFSISNKSKDRLNLLFVQHQYLEVEEWKAMRHQGALLDFKIQIVPAGILNGAVEGLHLAGANAIISFKSNAKLNTIINYIKEHPKLLLLGGRLSNQETYRSFNVSSCYKQANLSTLLNSLKMIAVLKYHSIKLLKVLSFYSKNKFKLS